MTICIGAMCEGQSTTVVASDRILTNRWLSIQFEHRAGKASHLSDSCVALAARDALAETELFSMVNDRLDNSAQVCHDSRARPARAQ
jgi:hypothetical protein